MKALVVERDADLLDLLAYVLRREGFSVVTAADGKEALRRWRAEAPDLVLLGDALPGLDAAEVCRRSRRAARTAVIVLSSRGADAAVVRALQAGADDHAARPAGFRELAARARAVLRRYQARPRPRPAGGARPAGLVLDPRSREVVWGERRARLTPLEFRILSVLAAHAGRVVPYRRLIEHAYGRYTEAHAGLLPPHLANIRGKLRLPANGPAGIEAIRGVGYRLALPGRAPPATPA